MNGKSKNEFAPEAQVTREQIATILWCHEGKRSAQADLNKFTDAGTISAYARDAMVWEAAHGDCSLVTAEN